MYLYDYVFYNHSYQMVTMNEISGEHLLVSFEGWSRKFLHWKVDCNKLYRVVIIIVIITSNSVIDTNLHWVKVSDKEREQARHGGKVLVKAFAREAW